jgi:hypothetical protein
MAHKKWKRGDLVEAFRAMGAADPEGMASSQLDDGVPELHRFAFLKRLWDQVVNPGDTKWIGQTVDQAAALGEDDPQAAAGPALRRILAAGVEPIDIIKVVWAAQAEMVYNIAFQPDDPGFAVAQLPRHGGMEEDDAMWGLFAVNEAGKPKQLIEGLHEVWTEIVPPPVWKTGEGDDQ